MDSSFEQFRHEFCGHSYVRLKKKGGEIAGSGIQTQALVLIFLIWTDLEHEKEAAGTSPATSIS